MLHCRRRLLLLAAVWFRAMWFRCRQQSWGLSPANTWLNTAGRAQQHQQAAAAARTAALLVAAAAAVAAHCRGLLWSLL